MDGTGKNISKTVNIKLKEILLGKIKKTILKYVPSPKKVVFDESDKSSHLHYTYKLYAQFFGVKQCCWEQSIGSKQINHMTDVTHLMMCRSLQYDPIYHLRNQYK